MVNNISRFEFKDKLEMQLFFTITYGRIPRSTFKNDVFFKFALFKFELIKFELSKFELEKLH